MNKRVHQCFTERSLRKIRYSHTHEAIGKFLLAISSSKPQKHLFKSSKQGQVNIIIDDHIGATHHLEN